MNVRQALKDVFCPVVSDDRFAFSVVPRTVGELSGHPHLRINTICLAGSAGNCPEHLSLWESFFLLLMKQQLLQRSHSVTAFLNGDFQGYSRVLDKTRSHEEEFREDTVRKKKQNSEGGPIKS